MKFHRLPASTEMRESGQGCSDQLTRLSNILKDAPKKKGLTMKPVHRIPPLAALDGPTSSHFPLGVGAPQRCVGFVPGDSSELAVYRDVNRIALKDDFRPEERFRLHHRSRRPDHRRPHLPNALVHGPTEMRPKWLSRRQAAECEERTGAAPIDGDDDAADGYDAAKTRAADAEMKVALENGAVERQLHPDADAGPLSADENAVTRVAATAAREGRTEARQMPKATPRAVLRQREEQQQQQPMPSASFGVENCVSNILNGLEYAKAATMSS